MWQQLIKTWYSNRGNLLLVLGCAAGLLMCGVWYFDLVPDVRLAGRNVSGTQIFRAQRQEQNPLVVTIRIPPLTAPGEEMPLVDLRIVVELHLPVETLQPEQVPLFSRQVTLRNDGKSQAVVFTEIQPGNYAVLAYIDLNSNDKFDRDEQHKPLEPYRLSRGSGTAGAGSATRDPDPKLFPLDLEEASIAIMPGQVGLVEFDFRMSAKP